MPTGARPRYDAAGNEIAAAPARPRPRQMRPAEERVQDENVGVRRQAAEQLAQRRPRFDAMGNEVQPTTPAPTRATRDVPERQAVVAESNPAQLPSGNPIRNLAIQAGNWISGNVGRDEDVGEVGWSGTGAVTRLADGSIPDFGETVGAILTDPEYRGRWLRDEGASMHAGLGFFLDPNEEHRAQIMQHQFPNAEFRRDQYGQLQVRSDESAPWNYINRPGLSVEDGQTFAAEVEKYLLTRRLLPGGRGVPGASSPLGTSTLREAAAGGLSMTAGQTAAMAVGGPGPDPVDVGVATAGGAAGNLVAAGLGATVRGARATPEAVRRTVDWIADRLPGGAQRAAERQAAAAQLLEGLEQAARRNAADTVRANAQTQNLAGEALERAVRTAEEEATAAVQQQAAGGSAALDRLARTFGVRLSKAQTEGDIGGQQFLYEAAGGMHGPGAQRAAAAFLGEQNQALPQGIREIAGNPAGITSPQSGVNVARGGVERAYDAARTEENAAWSAFDDASQRVRTYERTPQIAGDDGRVTGGNPSGVYRVRDNIVRALEEENIFIKPRTETPGAEGVAAAFKESYPLVARAMRMIDNLAPATRDEVPLRDVQRVLQIKRHIDDLWEQSEDNPAQRRLLSQMGSTVRDWLRGDGARELARRAPTTQGALQEALRVSQQTAQTFRENRLMQQMLDQRNPPTDDEIARRLFGGGQGGVSFSSDSVGALRAMREALGPTSPEWESIRQSVLMRLTRGLDDAVATNQTPAILTTFKRIDEAFRANREGMELLFSPRDLQRLRHAQQVLAAMAPTARNPANPSNSGIVAGRAARGLLSMLTSTMRNVPGANAVAGGLSDAGAAARVNVEIQGAPSESFRIARALADVWNVNRGVAATGGSIGAASETVDNADDRARAGF